jgi:TetR/AcrR family transcriptional regulator
MRRRAFPRDPKATKDRLLQTAERLFVERGFDLARVDDIAAQAQVNKRMLYAYFTDKQGLYTAILDANFSRMLDTLAKVADEQTNPRSDAERVIRTYFQFLAEHPAFVRLVAWESLRYGEQSGRVLAQAYRVSLRKLYDVVQRGVDQGAFRADLDVRRFVASVYGLCLSHFSQREFLNILWEKDSDSPEAREAALDHILNLVFHGIERRPQDPAPAQSRSSRR